MIICFSHINVPESRSLYTSTLNVPERRSLYTSTLNVSERHNLNNPTQGTQCGAKGKQPGMRLGETLHI